MELVMSPTWHVDAKPIKKAKGAGSLCCLNLGSVARFRYESSPPFTLDQFGPHSLGK